MKATIYSIITLLFFSNVFFVKGQLPILESDLVVSIINQNSVSVTTKNSPNLELEAKTESTIVAEGSNQANVELDVGTNVTMGNFVVQRLSNKTVRINTVNNNYKIDLEPVSKSLLMVKNHL